MRLLQGVDIMANAIIGLQNGSEIRVSSLKLIKRFSNQGIPKDFDSSKWDELLLDSGRCLFVGETENLFIRIENVMYVKIEK